MCCMSFGQFLELLFVITLTTFSQGLLQRGFPKFLILPFGKLVHLFIEL